MSTIKTILTMKVVKLLKLLLKPNHNVNHTNLAKVANQKREETKNFPAARKYEPTFLFQKPE